MTDVKKNIKCQNNQRKNGDFLTEKNMQIHNRNASIENPEAEGHLQG